MNQFGMSAPYRSHTTFRSSSGYEKPREVQTIALTHLLGRVKRSSPSQKQMDMLRSSGGDAQVFYSGALDLLNKPCVSIVGTRDVSEDGRSRAVKLARELVQAGVVVVSGLAKGVDTAALQSAIHHEGAVAAVIGTPIDKAYPAENAELQTTIWRDHLLLSPFPIGSKTYRSSFPARNRVMAALSDATVIVEASDSSGTLHQAAECGRLGRWLFIMRAVAEDPNLKWPASFIGQPRVEVLRSTDDILQRVTRD